MKCWVWGCVGRHRGGSVAGYIRRNISGVCQVWTCLVRFRGYGVQVRVRGEFSWRFPAHVRRMGRVRIRRGHVFLIGVHGSLRDEGRKVVELLNQFFICTMNSNAVWWEVEVSITRCTLLSSKLNKERVRVDTYLETSSNKVCWN